MLTVSSRAEEHGHFDEGSLFVEPVWVVPEHVTVYTGRPVKVWVRRSSGERQGKVGVLDGLDILAAKTPHLVLFVLAADLLHGLVELVFKLGHAGLGGKEDRLGHGAYE